MLLFLRVFFFFISLYTGFYLRLLLYFNISTDVILDFNFYPRINRQYIHTYQTFRECRQTFRRMSPNILGNVAKHSWECRFTLRGMSSNIKNLGPRIWNLVPDNLKQLGDIDSFKTEIKNWIPTKCPCRLCKPYIPNVGFV